MRPQLGDTIFNRYTTVSCIRDTPGISVWTANDRVLARDCQLFVVQSLDAVDPVNQVATELTLDHNDRFTQVLKFHRAGECCMLVTRIDPGMSISEYLRSARPLSYNAVRSIIGDVVYALETTRQGMLSTDTIRLSQSGVQIADAPVSMLLEDPSTCAPIAIADDAPVEQLYVRQLASVMYAMLVRKASSDISEYDLAALPVEIPGEFRIIIARGLGLGDPHDSLAVPMTSLAELKALLGYWTTVPELGVQDIALPSLSGAASAALAAFQDVDPVDLGQLPVDFITSTPMPELNIDGNGTMVPTQSFDVRSLRGETTGEMPVIGDPFNQFAGADPTSPFDSIRPIASTEPPSPGEATTRIPIISDDKPLSQQLNEAEELDAQNGLPPEVPMRNTAADATNVADSADASKDAGDVAEGTHATDDAHAADGAHTADGTETTDGPAGERDAPLPPSIEPPAAQPPSFAPAPHPSKTNALPTLGDDEDNDLSNSHLFGSMTTKVVAIVVGVILVVLAAVLAVIGLSFGGPRDDESNWPSDGNLDSVPFGNESTSDDSTKASGSDADGSDILDVTVPQW